MEAEESFPGLVGAILRRWFSQHGGLPLDEARVRQFGRDLETLVAECGLPRPLGADERGSPGGMTEAECSPLVDRVVSPQESPLWREAARQLVKACFYPEFKDCRDSYRQRTSDGNCRRQELARVRERLSGTHCVDCPHWVGMTAGEHEQFLGRAWCRDSGEFFRHRDLFLPEDFRALRRWLWREARRDSATRR